MALFSMECRRPTAFAVFQVTVKQSKGEKLSGILAGVA